MQLTDSDSRHNRCAALMDACTPMLYAQNAFRITGLRVDATSRDIKRRIDDLKAAAEMGDSEDEHTHVFALNPPPSPEQIRDASHRLHDPERRIIEEFFWFWPKEWGQGQADTALLALNKGDKDGAYKLWSAALANGRDGSSAVAKHNLAVMYHLTAMDSEQIALKNSLSSEQHSTISNYWRTCFKWWEELTIDEVFWSTFTARIRMLDDPRLTTGFARRLRATLPEAMDKINALLAVSFVEQGKLDLATNHIIYMKETHQGLDDIPNTLALVSKPLRSRITTAVEHAKAIIARTPQGASKAAHDLLDAARDPVRIFEKLYSPGDHEVVDVCDSIASTCLECHRAFGRSTSEWSTTILDKAQSFARSEELKAEFAEARDEAQMNRDFSIPQVKELFEQLAQADGLERTEKIKRIYRVAPSILESLATSQGRTSRAYVLCADAVANVLRKLSVDIYNTLSGSTPPHVGIRLLALAIELHDRAASIAVSSEAKARFREDEQTLSQYQSTPGFASALAAARAQLIQEGLLPLWGNSVTASRNIPPVYQPPTPKSGCFVATAVYGDYDHPSVVTLRIFRDRVLLKSILGRLFVIAYYAVGPLLAKCVPHFPRINPVCRRILDFVADWAENKTKSQ